LKIKPNLLIYDKTERSDDGKPAKLPKRLYSPTPIVHRMIGDTDRRRASEKPFLASVNFIANHIPVQARDADNAAYAGRYNAGWAALRKERRAAAIAKGVMPENVAMVTMGTSGDWSKLSAEQKRQRAGAMAA